MARDLMRPSHVFVFHPPRCGSTLLQLILSSHPDISITPESRAMVKFIRKLPLDRRLTADERDKARTLVDSDAKLLGWKIDLAPYYVFIDEAPDLTVKQLIDGLFTLYRDATSPEATILGTKREPLLDFIPQLLHMYPRSKFIFIYRDPRAASLSMVNHIDRHHTLDDAALKWWKRVDKAQAASTRYAGVWFDVKYEDLVAKPHEVCEALCAFLDVPFSEQMLQHHRKNENMTMISEYGERLHQNTVKPISTAFVDKWRGEMTSRDIKTVERITWRHMERLGYPLEHRLTIFDRLRGRWQRHQHTG